MLYSSLSLRSGKVKARTVPAVRFWIETSRDRLRPDAAMQALIDYVSPCFIASSNVARTNNAISAIRGLVFYPSPILNMSVITRRDSFLLPLDANTELALLGQPD